MNQLSFLPTSFIHFLLSTSLTIWDVFQRTNSENTDPSRVVKNAASDSIWSAVETESAFPISSWGMPMVVAPKSYFEEQGIRAYFLTLEGGYYMELRESHPKKYPQP